MEDSKLIPEENSSNESSSEIIEENNKEENVKAFTEFLDNSSNQNISEKKANLKSNNLQSNNDKSIFRRFLNNGIDGISSNPNFKMLALLIILLINLSLFFVIGNIGKEFLRNAGIMG